MFIFIYDIFKYVLAEGFLAFEIVVKSAFVMAAEVSMSSILVLSQP